MSAIGEDEHLIFTQKFSSGDYFFVYSTCDINFVGLIHNTPDSTDTLEAYAIYEYVVDTMGYDMLEEMELKNVRICDDSDYSCGREHEMDD